MRTGPHIQRRAFTVVELLVAIAVVAIIAVGLSTIFGSVGDAVTDGRRASEINRAAARMEQQIRDDLSRLTRDGFLVIANRYASDEQGNVFENIAGNPNQRGVQLSPRQREGRSRRADEIMFFARGDFQTKRPALAPGMVATAGEAAVYFGIGQKRPIDFSNADNPTNFFFNPAPSDANLRQPQGTPNNFRPLLGRPELPGRLPNPNRYAREWSLLRQVTLLADPQIVSVLPSQFFGLNRTNLQDRNLMLDSARQIAMQPAARSIFNSLSWTGQAMRPGAPGTVAGDGLSRWWIGDPGPPPAPNYGGPTVPQRSFAEWRASGVVDIAQGSILGVRREFEALAGAGILPSNYHTPAMVNSNPANSPNLNFNQTADGFRVQWNDHTTSPRPRDATNLSFTTHGQNIRAWALDMMPSLWDGQSNPPRYLAGVRYEDLPTRLILEPERFPRTDEGRLARAITESHQEMLASQVFVPRCSEFIVEWSYGYIDDTLPDNDPRFKQMIWYGLPRADRDLNNDGRVDLADHADPDFRVAQRYFRRGGANRPDPQRNQVIPGPSASNLTDPEIAVFGLTAGNDVIPWPRFLRFTISLADPDDDTVERTYQFVFAVPGEQG